TRLHTRLQGDWSSDVCSSDLRSLGRRWDGSSCSDSATSRIYLTERGPRFLARFLSVPGNRLWGASARGHKMTRSQPACQDIQELLLAASEDWIPPARNWGTHIQ